VTLVPLVWEDSCRLVCMVHKRWGGFAHAGLPRGHRGDSPRGCPGGRAGGYPTQPPGIDPGAGEPGTKNPKGSLPAGYVFALRRPPSPLLKGAAGGPWEWENTLREAQTTNMGHNSQRWSQSLSLSTTSSSFDSLFRVLFTFPLRYL